MRTRVALLLASIAALSLFAGCAPQQASCGLYGAPCCDPTPTRPACYTGLVCRGDAGGTGTCTDPNAPQPDASDTGPIGADARPDVVREAGPAMDAGTDVAPGDVATEGGGPADVVADQLAPDARPDVTAADVAADVTAVDVAADVTAVDVGADVTAMDVPSDVVVAEAGIDAATMDVVPEAAADATPDVVIYEASADVPVADACAACTAGAVRCNATTGNVEICQTGDAGCAGYVNVTTCMSPAGLRELCIANACTLCGIPTGGAPGCAVLCATDADCHDRGYARCSTGGACTRRGYLRCTSDADCGGFSTGTATSQCTLDVTVDGTTARVCDGANVARCTSDAMCTRSTRCNLATGFCGP
jgi:hypothetical protein